MLGASGCLTKNFNNIFVRYNLSSRVSINTILQNLSFCIEILAFLLYTFVLGNNAVVEAKTEEEKDVDKSKKKRKTVITIADSLKSLGGAIRILSRRYGYPEVNTSIISISSH